MIGKAAAASKTARTPADEPVVIGAPTRFTIREEVIDSLGSLVWPQAWYTAAADSVGRRRAQISQVWPRLGRHCHVLISAPIGGYRAWAYCVSDLGASRSYRGTIQPPHKRCSDT